MTKRIFFFLVMIAATLNAQNTRSWVASSGLDTNDCTRPNPCRTFDRAISVSNDGAEVVVMDSAGYGPTTIFKAIQIIAPRGVHAAIAPTTGTAIQVAPGGGTVVLRNLYLNSQGAATGIAFLTSGSLYVESCTISRFTNGITATVPEPGTLVVRDSEVSDNALDGIRFQSSIGTVTASIEDTLIVKNGNFGLVAQTSFGNLRVMARNVTAVNNGYQYLASTDSSGTTIELTLESSSGIGSGTTEYGLRAGAASGAMTTVRVSNSTITANAFGITTGGTGTVDILGRGNNTLEGNASGNAFTGSYSGK